MEKKKSTTIIYAALWIFTVVVAVALIITTVYNLTHTVAAAKWLSFWQHYLIILFFVGLPLVGLFVIGGFVDLMKLFKMLKEERVDDNDDGFVESHEKPETD